MKVKLPEKKFILRLSSIIMGIILWVIIIYIEDASFNTTLKGIPIQINGETELVGKGLIVVNKDDIVDAAVSVRGKRSDIINSINGITAYADVSKIEKEGTYNIAVNYEISSNALYITEKKTATAEIVVETIKSKDFKVEVLEKGTMKYDNKIIEHNIDLKTVTVKGAAKDIEKIHHMIVFIDVGSIVADTIGEYNIIAADASSHELKFTNKLYLSSYKTQVTSILHNKKTLPLKISLKEEDADKYAFETESISKQNIDVGIDTDTDINELTAVIDYDGELKDGEYTLNIDVPDGIYVPEEDLTLTAKIKAYPLVEKTVSVPLSVKANPNQTYNLQEELSFKVKGAEKDILPQNITADIDITGYKPGEYTVEVDIGFFKDTLRISEKQYVTVQIE